jgi:hypothetical protein
MHFIEQLFGISPDGGSGLLEFFLIFAPVGIAIVWVILRHVSTSATLVSAKTTPRSQSFTAIDLR